MNNWTWTSPGDGLHVQGAQLSKVKNTKPCQSFCSSTGNDVATPCKAPKDYYVEFKVLSSDMAINIGVSEACSNKDKRCGFDKHGWSFSLYSGAIYHKDRWQV